MDSPRTTSNIAATHQPTTCQATFANSNKTPLLNKRHMPAESAPGLVTSTMIIASKKLTKPVAFFRIALLLVIVLWQGELWADVACGDQDIAPIIDVEPQTRILRRLRGTDADTSKAIPTETIELIAPTLQTNHTTFKSLSDDLSLVRAFSKKKEVQFNIDNVNATKLCFFGSLGDLDELLHVFTRLMVLGQQLRRTVVVPPYFTTLYDPLLLNLSDRVQISRNQAFCDPRFNRPNVTYWDALLAKAPTAAPTDLRIQNSETISMNKDIEALSMWPAVLKDRIDAILYIGGQDLKAHEHDLFSTTSFKEEESERMLYANLFPYIETRELVHDFIKTNFENKPFVAVHLDVCESATTTTTNTTSSKTSSFCAETGPSLLRWVLQQHAASLVDAPVFVSVTSAFKQQNMDLLSVFRNTGAVMFENECSRLYECDMVNREIAAHSAFFYSARNSATTKHIQSLRKWRHNPLSKQVQQQQQPGLVQSFSIKAATQGGWKPDVAVVSVEPAVLPPRPSPPVQSHYEAYLSALEQQRPNMDNRAQDGTPNTDDITHDYRSHPERARGVVPINGVLCQFGLFEQLNNVLDQTAGLLHVGKQLGRTVVIPPLVSELYDVNYLENDEPFASVRAADGTWFRPSRYTTDESLCDPAHGWKFSDVDHKAGPTTFVAAYMNEKAPVLMVSAKSAFHYGFNDRSLFTHLHPRKETREIVVNFVQDNFGDKPFVAVHLRFLDGKCYIVSLGDVACDLDPNLLRWVLARNAPELLDAPVFVASDHQRPDLELLFSKMGAVFYRGECHSYDKQCMLIDAEIAARSAYFYGLQMSTAAQNIERFRRQRHNGTPFKQHEAFPGYYEGYFFAPTDDQWAPVRWQSDSPEKYFASRPKEAMEQIAGTLPPEEAVLSLTPVAEQYVKLRNCRTSFKHWFHFIGMLAIFYPMLMCMATKCLRQCGCGSVVELVKTGVIRDDPLDKSLFLAEVVVAARVRPESMMIDGGVRTGSFDSENSNYSAVSSKCD